MFVCDFMLMYVLYVSYKGQGMLTQWPAPDAMSQSIQSRLTVKYTLVPPHKSFKLTVCVIQYVHQLICQLASQIVLQLVIVSSLLLLTCVHSDKCLYIYINILCRNVDKHDLCLTKHELQLYYIKFICIILCYIILYCIILCYIILYYVHIIFISILIDNLFKDSNGKVKLERSRLWLLDNSWRKLVREADVGGGNTIQVCFPLRLC